MANSKTPWMYYYITITLSSGARYVNKVRAIHQRTAIIKALTNHKHNNVTSVRCCDGVPYTEDNRERMLANKRRLKERKQKQLEEDIMRYDGLTPIYDEIDD